MDFAIVRCPDCRSALGEDVTSSALRCPACGTSFPVTAGIPRLVGKSSQLAASEVETQDYVSDFYEDVRYKVPYARLYHEAMLDDLVALAAPRGRVLDDGCGNGVFLEHLTQRATQIEQYVGLDVSLGMLRHARARLERLDDRARGAAGSRLLVQGDACRLPFADASFDVVFARGLLHHLPDPAAGAAEISRVLKPGGSAVVLDPNRTLLSDLPRRLARLGKHFDEGHKNFRVDELHAFLSPHLSVQRVEYVGYVAYPLLGFPDVTNFGRVLPLDLLAETLIRVDRQLAGVPGVKRLGWGVMMSAIKS